jgi:RsiW-degrading membrane proteinase PrsW (M82 family)
MQYLFFIPLALLPSLLWLFWYLRKDKHQEPKRMILSVFVWGMFIAFPAMLVENAGIAILNTLVIPSWLTLFLIYFLVVAITEEVLKFSVVRFKVLNTAQLDEPVDAMVYMIIAALGFAAIENIFLLIPLFEKDLASTLGLVFSRFVGATLLHVLSSATLGYYLALSLYEPAKKVSLLFHGFALAILIHGFYNILVLEMEERFYFIFPLAAILVSTAALISLFFKKLSKMKSVSLPAPKDGRVI